MVSMIIHVIIVLCFYLHVHACVYISTLIIALQYQDGK